MTYIEQAITEAVAQGYDPQLDEISEAASFSTVQIAIAIIERNLSENPELGAPGRVPDTRELVVPHTPVIIPYRVYDGTLQILAVHHHARRWRDRFQA